MIQFVIVAYQDRAALSRVIADLERSVHVPWSLVVIDNTFTNPGYAPAANLAARLRPEGEYVAFVNLDMRLPDGWLEPVLATLHADDDLVIAGPRCLDGLPWPRVPEGMGAWVCGACMIVKRWFWDQVGGFDSDLFPHEFSETDLERQAEALGYRVQTVEAARVYHDHEPAKPQHVLDWRATGERHWHDKWALA